jgi:hypothetical protein
MQPYYFSLLRSNFCAGSHLSLDREEGRIDFQVSLQRKRGMGIHIHLEEKWLLISTPNPAHLSHMQRDMEEQTGAKLEKHHTPSLYAPMMQDSEV